MEYSAWKLFVTAAELGSLSKTAAAYMTTQPHISRQITALEQECGGRLFQRTGRGVVLTELGELIAPKIRAWLANTELLANDILATSGKPVGTVRLGILPSTAQPLISALYYALRERYPLVQLVVREGQGAQIETLLENGEVDLAILYRQHAIPANGDIYLAKTDTYLIGARGDPLVSRPTISFSFLHRLPLVVFCRPNSWRDCLDRLCASHAIAPNIVLEADSIGLQTKIVADGGVYGLLGAYAVADASARASIQASRIVEPDIPRYVALAMSRRGELTLACRTVMKLAQEIAKTNLAGSAVESLAGPLARENQPARPRPAGAQVPG